MRHNFSGRLNAEEYERLNRVGGLTDEQIRSVAPSAFAGQAHDSRSNRYAFVPTVAVIDGMREQGFIPVRASQSLARTIDKQPFTKHMIRFRQQGAALNQVGDSVLETVLTNSHDGTSAYTLSLGVFRLACTNGLMVSEGLVRSVHVRHVGDVVNVVIESSFGLIKEAPKVAETINQWRGILTDEQEQLILANGAADIRFENNPRLRAAIPAVKLLEARRIGDQANDLWTVFNRVQENAIKGGVSGFDVEKVRRETSRPIKGIDSELGLNKALWRMTEFFAAKKLGNALPEVTE
jgi:Domain of unknown function (DUF932)